MNLNAKRTVANCVSEGRGCLTQPYGEDVEGVDVEVSLCKDQKKIPNTGKVDRTNRTDQEGRTYGDINHILKIGKEHGAFTSTQKTSRLQCRG